MIHKDQFRSLLKEEKSRKEKLNKTKGAGWKQEH